MGMSPMAELGSGTTVANVSLRSSICDMLIGGDPTALSEVPAAEVAQALTNYADTASLAEADALAPIVTRASHVPFDEEIDGDLGAPLVDVHAELATIEQVDLVDSEAATVDPGDSIDDAAVGNELAAEGEADTDPPNDDDSNDDGTESNAEVDPDGWFESDVDDRSADAASLEAPDSGAAAGGDVMAFGSGDLESTPEVGPTNVGSEPDEAFEPLAEFADVGLEFDAINELPTVDAELDPGYVETIIDDVDDAATDDSFGDVDFDV